MVWVGVIALICVPLASAAHGAARPAICRRLSVGPYCDSFVVRRVQKLLPPPHPSDIFVSYMGILLTFHTPSGEHMQTSSQRWWWDYRMSWSVFYLFFFRLCCLHDMYVWSNICLKSLLLQKDFLSFFLSLDQNQRERWPSFCPWILSWTQKETLRSPHASQCGNQSVALRPVCHPQPLHAALKDTSRTVQTQSYCYHCWESGMFFHILQTHIQTIAGTLLLFNCTLSSSRHTPLI